MAFIVKITYLNSSCKIQKYGNWIDVKASKQITGNVGVSRLIPLGFKTEMDKYLRAEIKPRSSSFKYYNFIQTNSVGEIESNYGDEWKLPVYFLGKGEISEGDRIAQINFSVKADAPWYIKLKALFCKIKIKEVSEVDIKSTRKGFGSTGIKSSK